MSQKLRDLRHRANTLVRNALGTPAGELLLADLERRYVDIDLHDPDHAAMAAAVGRRDLIALLRRQLTEDLNYE